MDDVDGDGDDAVVVVVVGAVVIWIFEVEDIDIGDGLDDAIDDDDEHADVKVVVHVEFAVDAIWVLSKLNEICVISLLLLSNLDL